MLPSAPRGGGEWSPRPGTRSEKAPASQARPQTRCPHVPGTWPPSVSSPRGSNVPVPSLGSSPRRARPQPSTPSHPGLRSPAHPAPLSVSLPRAPRADCPTPAPRQPRKGFWGSQTPQMLIPRPARALRTPPPCPLCAAGDRHAPRGFHPCPRRERCPVGPGSRGPGTEAGLSAIHSRAPRCHFFLPKEGP